MEDDFHILAGVGQGTLLCDIRIDNLDLAGLAFQEIEIAIWKHRATDPGFFERRAFSCKSARQNLDETIAEPSWNACNQGPHVKPMLKEICSIYAINSEVCKFHALDSPRSGFKSPRR